MVYLSPDEAIQLSNNQSYFYGAKNMKELQEIKANESLKQRFNRLKKHPAYENLLKMRENTKASELKGARVLEHPGGVYYDEANGRYLRYSAVTRPNYEEVITITKADVRNLRNGKIDDALLSKLENSLDGLQADPKAAGVLDQLLTRDYHAGDIKQKEYMRNHAPDEVFKISENSAIKTAENSANEVGENSKTLSDLQKEIIDNKYYKAIKEGNDKEKIEKAVSFGDKCQMFC